MLVRIYISGLGGGCVFSSCDCDTSAVVLENLVQLQPSIRDYITAPKSFSHNKISHSKLKSRQSILHHRLLSSLSILPRLIFSLPETSRLDLRYPAPNRPHTPRGKQHISPTAYLKAPPISAPRWFVTHELAAQPGPSHYPLGVDLYRGR